MIVTRRRALAGLAAGLLLPAHGWAAAVVEIRMRGDFTGAHVGFDPIGLRLRPGQTVRWTNGDDGNAHTATAYHPDNGRPRRIPAAAKAWNSDYLLPGETFSVTLTAEGVYDFFCMPHEHAGMVGRLVVGEPRKDDWMQDPGAGQDLPASALAAFPSVDAILAQGIVAAAAD